MAGNGRMNRLKELFRFRSMHRHQEIRRCQAAASTVTAEVTENKSNFPLPSVPIVCVECDSSFDAEGEDFEGEHYRVRSFKRTSKGVISLGDSFRSRSTSNCSYSSHSLRCSNVSADLPLGRYSRLSNSYTEAPNFNAYRQERYSMGIECACAQSQSERLHFYSSSIPPVNCLQPPSHFGCTNSAAPVKVQLLGGPTVGKTMLYRQFLTAEFMGGKTESFSDDSVEQFVMIEVDGWNGSLMLIDNIREESADESNSTETGLIFPIMSALTLDEAIPRRLSGLWSTEPSTLPTDALEPQVRKYSLINLKPETPVYEMKTPPKLEMRILDVSIYVVVYSVDEEASFEIAKCIFRLLQNLKKANNKLQLFYLVGNKTDLVRSRQVTTRRGREFAVANGAIFFEVSAAINHLVDELLVDMVVRWRKEVTQYELGRLGLPVHSTVTAVAGEAGRQSWTSTLNSPKNLLQRIFKQQFTTKSCMDLQKS